MGFGDRATVSLHKGNHQSATLSRYEAWMQQLQRPEFICGWGAAFVNICVTFPINKVMFRQQLHGLRVLQAVKELQMEGLTHIYRGLLPPLLQKTTSMSLMFGLYHEFQRDLNYYFPNTWYPVTNATAAILAGSVEALLTPFERLQVLMQDRKYHRQFNNTFHAFKELRPYGLSEYYRGMMAVLLRNGPSNVLFFLGRDYFQKAYPEQGSQSQKVFLDFVSGACLGAFISSVFYPMNVVKVRMQSKLGGEYCRLVPTFIVIWNERGRSIKKMCRGMHVNYTRAFISWGIVNASYELLMNSFFTDPSQDH